MIRMRGQPVRTAVIGVWGLSLLSALTVSGCQHAPPLQQWVAVPAYWTPAIPTGQAEFAQLARSAAATRIVVVNGSHSAPESPYNPAWSDTFRSLRGAGIKALGYVDTGYFGIDFGPGANATRPDGPGAGQRTASAWTRQIETDVDNWYALYGASGVGGIFLDQTAAVCGPGGAYAHLYQVITDYIRAHHPDAYVVMNPGRSMAECYRGLADTFVTFEGSYSDYLTRTAPAWESTAPADTFWHLVYDVPDQASLAHAVALSKQRNARYVYVTDGTLSADGREHPWAAIPPEPYWRAELTAVSGRNFAAASPT
jgi:hypothetical protein